MNGDGWLKPLKPNKGGEGKKGDQSVRIDALGRRSSSFIHPQGAGTALAEKARAGWKKIRLW
jgi:hypothetical protein